MRVCLGLKRGAGGREIGRYVSRVFSPLSLSPSSFSCKTYLYKTLCFSVLPAQSTRGGICDVNGGKLPTRFAFVNASFAADERTTF